MTVVINCLTILIRYGLYSKWPDLPSVKSSVRYDDFIPNSKKENRPGSNSIYTACQKFRGLQPSNVVFQGVQKWWMGFNSVLIHTMLFWAKWLFHSLDHT